MRVSENLGLNDQGELISVVYDSREMYNIHRFGVSINNEGEPELISYTDFPTMRSYKEILPEIEKLKENMRHS